MNADAILRVIIAGRNDLGQPVSAASNTLRGLTTAIGGTRLATLGWAGAIAGAGTALFNMAKNTAQEVETLDKMARGLNTSIQFINVLDHAARVSDVSVETLHQGLFRLVDAISSAAHGNEALEKTFVELKLDSWTLQFKTLDEQVKAVSDALRGVETAGDRVRIVKDLMGRSGHELLNVLANEKKSIKEFADEAEKLGVIFSPELELKAEKFDNWLDNMGETFRGAGLKAKGWALDVVTAFETVKAASPSLREVGPLPGGLAFTNGQGGAAAPTPPPPRPPKALSEAAKADMDFWGFWKGREMARQVNLPPLEEFKEFKISGMEAFASMDTSVNLLKISLDDLTSGTLPGFRDGWVMVEEQISKTNEAIKIFVDDSAYLMENVAITIGEHFSYMVDSIAIGLARATVEQKKFSEIGKAIWRDFRIAVIAEINRIIIRQIISAVLSAIIGGKNPGDIIKSIQGATAAMTGASGGSMAGLAGTQAGGGIGPAPSRAFVRRQSAINLNVTAHAGFASAEEANEFGRRIGHVVIASGALG